MHVPPAVNQRGKTRIRLNDLDGREWVQATKTIMFQHGLGSSHAATRIERKHPAPFSYRSAEKLIRFFSKKGESVLDPFCGVGSTLKACALSRRKGTGIELNKTFYRLARARIAQEIETAAARREQVMLCGDARHVVGRFKEDQFSFILTSPAYWNILSKPGVKTSTRFRKGSTSYGSDKRDFGCIEDYDEFVDSLARFVDSLKRVLQPKRYMAIMVADFRHGERLYPLQADLITALRQLNRSGSRRLVLQGIKIIAQNHKKLYPYGFPTTYVPNIHHHYVLIFRNFVASDDRKPPRALPSVRGSKTAPPLREVSGKLSHRLQLAKRKTASRSAKRTSKGPSTRRRHSQKAANLRKQR